MDRMLKGLIVTLFGVATTALTAAGLVYLELRYDCAIYSFVYGFVIPFGAFLSGLVAASGYLVGSRLLSYRPGRALLAVLLAVSGGNFFLIYWLKYVYTTVDGEPIRGWISYSGYLAFTLRHTSLGTGDAGDQGVALGAGGYAFAALLIVGFALGGFCMYALVRSAPYCEGCGLYLKNKGKQTRYFERQEQLIDCTASFRLLAEQGEFREAMYGHAETGTKMEGDATGYASIAGVMQCRGCGKQWFQLLARKRVNKKWTVMAELKYAAFGTETVDALEEMTGAV
jgi:hypothetical protein